MAKWINNQEKQYSPRQTNFEWSIERGRDRSTVSFVSSLSFTASHHGLLDACLPGLEAKFSFLPKGGHYWNLVFYKKIILNEL